MKRQATTFALLLFGLLLFGQNSSSSFREQIKLQTNYDLYVTGENVHLTLACSIEGIPSPLSQIVYLELIDEEKEAKIQLIRDLEDGRFTGSFFLPSALSTGNYALIAYTNWMKNDPSSFFKKCITIVNPFESISTEVFSNELGTTLLQEGQESYSFTNIAQEVLKIDSVNFSTTTTDEPTAGLFLSVKRNDERNSYRSPAVTIGQEALLKAERSRHLPEMHGHLLSGTVTDDAGMPVETSLSLSNRALLHPPAFTKTKKNGDFVFVVSKEQRAGTILITSKSNFNVAIASPFYEHYDHLSIPELSLPENLKDWLLRRAQQIQIEDNYFAMKFAVEDPDEMPGVFDLIASKTYYLDDYKRFPKMEDPIVEYIPEVSFKVQGDQKKFTFPEYLAGGTSDSTLVLLNGIPVTYNTLFAQNPSYIEKITVYQNHMAINQGEFRGVVHFETFERFEDKISGNKAVTVTFAAPNYKLNDPKGGQYPDYRDQLIWEDFDSIMSTWSFKTSLNDGEYEVLLMDLDGQVLGRDSFFVN